MIERLRTPVPCKKASAAMIEVTQADRDAAADYLDITGVDWGACGDVRHGRVEHPLAQAFARHRNTGSRQVTDREVIARALSRSIDGSDEPSGKAAWHGYIPVAEDVLAALEASGRVIVPVEPTDEG